MEQLEQLKVLLRRGKIGINTGIDVTAKSATDKYRCLAPSWAMVRESRADKLEWKDYRILYHVILGRVSSEFIAWFYRTHVDVCFLCYCHPDKEHCHVDLLIDYLVGSFPHNFARPTPDPTFPDLTLLNGGKTK